MKIYRLLLMSIFSFLFSCNSETEVLNDDDPCPKGQIVVKERQFIKFVNNGNWAKNIEYEKLSLIATDSSWNYLYAPNGNLIADLPNYVEIIKYFNENNEIEGLRLELGHVPYRDEVSKTASAYFLLKIDDTTFDKIIGYYDTRCGNLLLTKISYNDMEYPANEFEPIEIIKD